ncbi:site-specific integrase [Bosea sp. ASV33]|uniref:site-specific integrase n=1 Tax=Bosea sp. ASV33 TaxID=2795106 RepID=UPI0018EA4D9D|nr:site-specific integrase [Bosea sp. ASV33]
MYLHRRGAHWWFRKAVPVDLTAILGFEQVRRSLRTKDSALARRRALHMLIRVDDVYAVLRSKRPLGPTREVALALLDEALETNAGTRWSFEFKRDLINDAKAAISNFASDQEPAGERAQTPPRRRRSGMVSSAVAFELLGREAPRGPTNQAAIALLSAVGQMGAISPAEVRTAGSAVTDISGPFYVEPPDQTSAALRSVMAQLAELQAIVEKTNASVSNLEIRQTQSSAPADVDTVSKAIAEERRTRWSDEPLSEAIKQYDAAVISLSSNGLKHIEDVRTRLFVFLTFVGDKPVRDVSRDDIKIFRDHLERLPDRAATRFKTLDVREAIALNAKRKPPVRPIGPVTINLKYLGPVHRFLDWLVDEEKIERNPGEGIGSIRKEKKRAKHKRLPFKPDQISRFFAETAKSSKVSPIYWIPPLMLFTGARINELAQLRTDDIKHHNGRLHLSIVCLSDESDETGDEVPTRQKTPDERGVKTDAARRVIPIHNELLRLGFIEFVASRRDRKRRECQLFDELKANRHGHWSAAVSKTLNRRLRTCGIKNPIYSAYSLRHSFRDACVDGKVREETRMKFMGHQLPGMNGVYGNPDPLQSETDEIDLVAFPHVDLGPYLKK